jgi:hypothetical protein
MPQIQRRFPISITVLTHYNGLAIRGATIFLEQVPLKIELTLALWRRVSENVFRTNALTIAIRLSILITLVIDYTQ